MRVSDFISEVLATAWLGGCASVLGRSALMRAAFPIACLIFCGCDSSPPTSPWVREVADKSGANRLALIYISPRTGAAPDKGFEFHSLVWRTKADPNWNDRVVITELDFQAGGLTRRWVSEIHSFDARTGNAVIKVAEASPPRTNGTTISTAYLYSWREWNITTNAEVRVLRVCKQPFEPFNLSLSYRLRERVINRR